MASISLRSYINEINDMVDQRQIDESIAHCRHVLETFPKHVDTYRLLGKAYLEEQRYSDASDILQRVLSSVPEDFIAQVGMSIIREDEGNLDSAIYHMERAFETQPSNHAIQSELRRLNTERDGIEMKRVRLTRGALARMYAHGNLYEQAISELHAALAEEPSRYDLQSLLAEMYYQTDKKVDAAETCAKILEKLPNCINANRLLTVILEESSRPEEAQRYRQRWSALDPYAEFVSTEYPTVEQVPDNKVSIDHFEWDPGELYAREGEQPGWASSLGVSISEGEDQDSLPDWLNGEITSADDQLQELDDEFPTGDYRPTEMLPEDVASGEVDAGDLGKIEDGRIDLMPQVPAEEAEEEAEPDWLSEFEDKGLDIEADDEDDWLASLEEAEEESAAPAGVDPLARPADEQKDEDWLGLLDTPQADAEDDLFESPVSDQEEDDWLASLDVTAEPADGAPDEATEEEEPDWLAALGPAAQQTDDAEEDAELPDFLKEAGWEPGSGEIDESAPIEFEEDEDQTLEEAEIPDWIKEMAPSEDAVDEDEEDLEAEADPEWLKSLETPPSTETPDWLSEMEQEPGAEPIPPAETPQAPSAGTEIEPDEMDLAWLENLAAKRGIPDEELVTSAEQRASLTEEDQPAPEETGEELDTPPVSEEPPADTDWMAQIGEPQEEVEDHPETEAEPEEEPGEETATWLSSIADDREVSPIPGVGDDTISRFLAAKDVLEPDDEPARIPPEEVTADWLAEIGEETEEADLAEGGPVSEEEDDFDTDWLRQIGQQAAREAAETEAETESPPSQVDEEADDFDMDWLTEIGEEAAQEAGAGEPAAEDTAPEPPEEEEPEEEEKWLAPPTQSTPVPLDAEPEDYDEDWLSEVGEEVIEKAAAPEPPGEQEDWLSTPPTDLTPADEPEITPIDEEVDDFDMDWLTQIGEEAIQEAADEAISPGELADEEQEEDWLASLAAEEEQTSEELLPTDKTADELSMDWIEQVSEEAAQQADREAAASEPAEAELDETDMSWLDEFDQQDEQAEAPPQTVAGLPDEDEIDDWLEEAVIPSAAGEQAEDDLDLDWLDELDDSGAEETAAESIQPSAAVPIDEEADDFDMDWLNEIGEEAAAEAAEEPDEEGLAETSRSAAFPVEVEPEDFAEDMLTEAAAPETPTEEDEGVEPTQPSAAAPVDEEADDFDMDWLEGISEEAAQEAAEEELEDDWLAETTQTGSDAPVDEEADDFSTAWLEEIGAEAAQEAAAGEQEPEEPIEAEPASTDDWLAHLEQEDEGSLEKAISDTDAWLLSMEDTVPSGETPAPEETEQPEQEIEDSSDWLASLGVEQDEEEEAGFEEQFDLEPEPEAEMAPEEPQAPEPEPEDSDDWLASLGDEQEEEEEAGFEEQFDLEPEAEMAPEEPQAFEPEPPAAEVHPTWAEDWQTEAEPLPEEPEPEAEAQVEPDLSPAAPPEAVVEPEQPEPVEEPAAVTPAADTPADQLDAARQAVSGGYLDEALGSYTKLIKKGKLLNEIIKDLTDATMRHPINVKLWQTLGDAYLRMDNLQDALDAYSKAEDLIR